MLPLWPRLIVPGCGQYVRPCGFPPVSMVAMISPVSGLNTLTVPWKRFETHSWLPSGETVAMSGDPPAVQESTIVRLARSMTSIVLSSRFVRNRRLTSRLNAKACAVAGRDEADRLHGLVVDDVDAVRALVGDVEDVAARVEADVER